MQRHRLTRYLAVLVSLVLAPPAAWAQAFGINEIGSCAFARGFSATSAPCNDASTIFWNPGAAARLKGNSILGGAAAILIKAEFERDSALGEHEGDVPVQIIPHLFLNRGEGNLSYGIGVYVPYGLTSQWEDDFPGRFLAKKASIATIYVQPNVAMSFRNGKWLVGGGPVVGHSTVELIQSADLAEQIATVDSVSVPGVRNVIRFSQLGIARRTEFARATLKGSATAFGLNIGALGKLSSEWTMGVRYLSSLMFEYEDADATFEQVNTGLVFAAGNPICAPFPPGCPANTQFDTLAAVRARFAQGGLLSSQTVSTRIAHPDQFQLGFSYTGFRNWMIAVDYAWTGWRKFRELPVDFSNDSIASPCPTTGAPTSPCDYNILDRELLEDYNNTSAIRVGAERLLQNGWLVRFGFSGVAAAAPDETVTPLLPEQDRTYWTLGTEIPLMKDRAVLDAAYGFVWGGGRRGRIDERLTRSTLAPALNSGVYSLSAHVLSFSLKATF